MSVNHFIELDKRGYKKLVPIIPPNATLSANTKVRNSDRGKVPGKMLPDGTWIGFKRWTEYQSSEKDYDRWYEWGAGVGIVCGEVFAVDIDVTDSILAAKIRQMVHASFGPAPVRIGRPPKSLLVYRCTDEIKKHRLDFMGSDGKKHAIEILGKGQQFVAHGMHPCGKPYSWENAESTLPDITEIGLIDSQKAGSLWG